MFVVPLIYACAHKREKFILNNDNFGLRATLSYVLLIVHRYDCA